MNENARVGRLFGVGVGPGDPELLTLKAARIIREAQVVAYLAARRNVSNARAIAQTQIRAEHIELPLIYPMTVEVVDRTQGYEETLRAFYDESAKRIAAELEAGRDVAILCEGDPFFYGSYMYLHDRLAHRYTTEVVPGVPSVMGAAARLGTPLVRRDSPLRILPGTLPEEQLADAMADGSAYAIMKLGRNFPKVLSALKSAGVLDRALYIERATMAAERIVPIQEVLAEEVPYFSLVVVPGREVEAQNARTREPGNIRVVGLGPGAAEWLSPEAREALRDATDLVGYHPYLDRVPTRAGQERHGSDNRVEIQRARHALSLAQAGKRVCVVSSGDPGIFAMATAVMEAIEHGEPAWRELDVRVLPGISAMQAAASRVGAPLGHDFCVISLSDRLKPWDTIARRLEAAASADFVIALYNPISSQRVSQLDEARTILLQRRAPGTPVILARDIGGPTERIRIVDLASFNPRDADMRTVVLIGSSATRAFANAQGRHFVYTPRTYRTNESERTSEAEAATEKAPAG